ncbi:hypothetical protein GCM10025751_46210 [Haladaptatus pallidirubidus]|uniref:Glucose-methanol-choline oxidoreductase N-terminal domain-containing protein n=1 Tax=Haladaptatus pallidirubidus TaxID=1008152 RepID=A0AAV3UNP3_9EURY|nr:GMC family oxidoreductase N-terminal domain-containing protein [Haladaptatus pallidirubidus]
MTQVRVKAGEEVHFERNTDFNGERQAGIGSFHLTPKDGQRHSAAAAYLKPVSGRSSLSAETDARMTHVLFDGDRTMGVEYSKAGQRRSVGA